MQPGVPAGACSSCLASSCWSSSVLLCSTAGIPAHPSNHSPFPCSDLTLDLHLFPRWVPVLASPQHPALWCHQFYGSDREFLCAHRTSQGNVYLFLFLPNTALGKFHVHFLHILPLFDDVLPSMEHPAENLELIAHQQDKLVTLPLQTTWIWLLWEKCKQDKRNRNQLRVGSEWALLQNRREGPSQGLDVFPPGYSQKGF